PLPPPWSGGCSRTCPSCCPSSLFPGTCGANCAPPTSSSAASSKCGAALVPWCALLMWRASTASSTPSSRDSTWNGKPAPSTYLHKQLDVTPDGSECNGLVSSTMIFQ